MLKRLQGHVYIGQLPVSGAEVNRDRRVTGTAGCSVQRKTDMMHGNDNVSLERKIIMCFKSSVTVSFNVLSLR